MSSASDPGRPGKAAERLISPALRQRLQQCFEHAYRLMQQPSYDFDYAHSMLLECVTRDPGNLVYLDAFLANLHRKYNHNKRGALLHFGGKSAFKRALARRDWAEVLKLGPRVLKANPWDVATLRAMAEACGESELYEAEMRYLRNALEVKPADPEVNRHCARSLSRLGQFDQAIACWQRVDDARGGDAEAQEMIAELQIEKTQQGLGKSPSTVRVRRVRPVANAADDQPPSAPPPRRPIELTPRQRFEQAIVQIPTDLENYFALADLHVQEKRLGEAAHVLTKALAVSGNDWRVQQRLEDVEIARLQHAVEVAQQRAQRDPGQENRQLCEQLRGDLNRYELEVFDRRAQRLPHDLELKFQLGLRLKRAGNLREAIAQLEKAAQLADRKPAATLELGECWQRRKDFAKALEHYGRAAELAADAQQYPLRNLAWYRAAVLAAALDDLTSAETTFAQLLDADPNFRDAAARLDKIRQMRHKGGL
jgi:tetratricopeptide (TPR) repeat protein